jgi:PPM family protein phosphatase
VQNPPTRELLTIGAFSRTSQLSIKALRLYDEIGLLSPVRTDPVTGYRYYSPGQLDRARRVAWLRRLGMPLARIRHVCETAETDQAAAARSIREYWQQVEADTAVRRELADFLIAQLSSTRETPMSNSIAPLHIRYAAMSDRGLVRTANQDCAFAGPRLLAVADGFGEMGAEAGQAAIDALRAVDVDAYFTDAPTTATAVESGDLLNLLHDAALRANQAVRSSVDSTDRAGTTLTAMLWTGSQLALVHIGDSRAYLLRDASLFQITEDHTLVQSLIEEGRLTPEEALSHPQRTLLVRALGGSAQDSAFDPQLKVSDVRAGDRYLLCTDGLSATVATSLLHATLAAAADPDTAVHELIQLSREAGGPDNVACVVADLMAAA